MTKTQRRTFTVLAGALVVPLVVAAAAYACTALATLSTERKAAQAGEVVNGKGTGFDSNPASSKVEVHFNTRDGEVLWSGSPAPGSGTVQFSFKVPDVAPGQYVLIATQTNAQGNPVGGTPARTSFEVTAPAAAATTQTPAATPAQESAQPASQPAASPAPAATPTARQPVTAAAPSAAAPAPAPVAPATAAPSAPAPAATAAPAPVAAAAREAVASPGSGDGSAVAALGLVAFGLLMSIGAAAYVLAGQVGDRRASAFARRR